MSKPKRPPTPLPGAAAGSNSPIISTIDDLRPDDRNANRGTDRGNAVVLASLQKYGAGRSVVTDRNGTIIAGNKTVENARAAGMTDVIVVPSDGSKLVVVQRTDLEIDDARARELAVADNRSAEVGLSWDPDVLEELSGEIDLTPFFTTDEMASLLRRVPEGEMPELRTGDKEPFQQLTFTLHDSQVTVLMAAMAKAKAEGPYTGSPNENSNGNALARVCERYLAQPVRGNA